MKKETSNLIFGLLLGLIVASAAFTYIGRQAAKSVDSRQAQVLELKFGHSLPTTHPVHQSIEYMAKRVEELSDGQMKLTIFPSGQLGDETKLLEHLQTGTLAMTKTSAGVMGNFVKEMKIFSIPYLFRDEGHYWQVIHGQTGKDILDKLAVFDSGEPSGFKGLCFMDAGSRSFYTKKPVRKPEDLKGLNIRTMRDQVAMDTVQAMGGIPTAIAWGELYTALKQGVVDGAENNPPSITSSHHYEVCKYYTLDHHSRIPDVVLMSASVWDKLTGQQKRWITDAADEASLYQKDLWSKTSAESMETMRDAGVEIIEVDTAAFRKAAQPALDKNLKGSIKALYDTIQMVQ